ncbi:EAL domain-containing protein [Shewanella sp. WXL01]|uniref:EAL domain-containing protein n=1 Tax=Shewanella sp. WXL01 TaxID=2709721 RepID=UPI0014382AA4|nr:EAL domain-containing protein [Shewanella sp. WXL01]NKF49949.1 EAL domain-containing protein [Shewanella sp. WXL01]
MFALLLCLLPIQTWLINHLASDSLEPHTLTVSLPLPDSTLELNGISQPTNIDKIFISGNFSDWYSDDPFYQMQQVDENRWQYQLALHPGLVEYKMAIYLKDSPDPVWITDPSNPDTAENPWGGINSVLNVPDWPKIRITTKLFTLSLLGAILLFFCLEPILYWLLHLNMPFHRKLMWANLLILICAQVVFFGYQLHQSRQLIKLSLTDAVHNMHLMLASEDIDFNRLPEQRAKLKYEIDDFFTRATTRIDSKQNSLFQITISDFAVFDANGELLTLHHRDQNRGIQQDRAARLGFDSTEDYFTQGVWAEIIPIAKAQALSGQLVTGKRSRLINSVETGRTFQSEWALGFSQMIQPIVIRGQLQGFYGASIQVKLFGAELLKMLLFQLLLLSGVLALASWLLIRVGKIVTEDVLLLTSWTQKIVKGDLNEQLKINSQDEIQQLAENFELMRQSLNGSFNRIEQQKSNLYFEAYFNNLTGLPNRKKLYSDMAEQTPHALMVLNINQFGQINDFYSLATGDAILQEVASRLVDYAKEHHANEHQVYKTSADEFAITIANPMDEQQLMTLAERIMDEVSEHAIEIDDNELYINMIAGAALCVDNNYSRLHQQADLARRFARDRHQRFRLFTEDLLDPKAFEDNMHQSRLVAQAVQNDLVVPFVQMIKPLTGGVPKFECLMRIRLEDGHILTPAMFMQTALRSRLYPHLMQSMLEKSFALFANQPYDFSVNVTLDDIADPIRLKQLQALLQANPETCKRLTFELLESEQITNYDLVRDFIKLVKPMGCTIAIDDFGAGYSNFVHLLGLDIDIVKIDGSLIRNLDTDAKAQQLVETVVSFAKKMGILTVAEFVDSQQVLDKVIEYQIDFAQGFYLGKPQPCINSARRCRSSN